MKRKSHKKGYKLSVETRAKMSLAKKGNKYTLGIAPWNKGKKYPQISGEKHFNWKGGITTSNRMIRRSLEYKLWKEAVFKRDDYTCSWCGARNNKGLGKSIKIEADHIKPFSHYPELRFSIDNGRTLCVDCHSKTDTYKGRSNYKKPCY